LLRRLHTLNRLRSLRAELIDPTIAEYRGRIVKTTGDGLLVEFSSVVDALRCATHWFAAIQMIDVHVPTTDGRELLLTRYTEPDAELRLLLDKLKLALPAQSPPKITTAQIAPQPPP
jgi:class 3 adenylate cyclase